MLFIKWHKKYELGIEELDKHHRHLVDLLNIVYDGLKCGAERDVLGAVLDELANYAIYHFATEEHEMEVHKFTDLSHHMEEHEKFSIRINEFQKVFHEGKADLSVEMVQFIYNWLMHHILNVDAKYGLYVKGLPQTSE